MQMTYSSVNNDLDVHDFWTMQSTEVGGGTMLETPVLLFYYLTVLVDVIIQTACVPSWAFMMNIHLFSVSVPSPWY